MVSNEYVKKALSDDLSKIEVYSIPKYAREHRDFIDKIYANGTIEDTSIDEAIEKSIKYQANLDINRINKFVDRGETIFLDDWGLHPECLVYAWQKQWIRDREFAKIKMDHGCNMANVQDRYNTANYVKHLRNTILTEKFEPSKSISSCEGYHCCCYW